MISCLFKGVDLAIVKDMVDSVQESSTTVLYSRYELDLGSIKIRVSEKFCACEYSMERTSEFI